MEETNLIRKPTRDYQSFSGTRWGLWETLYARRSHRKYLPLTLDDATVSDLEQLVGLACAARGARPDSIIAVSEPGAVDAVRQVAYKGVTSKINLWLAKASLAAWLIMDLPAPDVYAHRPLELPRSVLALEDSVLWLTERRLATCWLAGVNQREIVKVLGLPAGRSIPAVISVGRPAVELPRPASYGGISYQMMTRRRKPLSSIACVGDAGTPYEAPDITPGGFSAPDRDMRTILELIRDGMPGSSTVAPAVDLAVDSCLEAARVAPSAKNSQPWLFVVVTDAGGIERLRSMCQEPPPAPWKVAMIAAAQDRKLEKVILDKPFWDIDVPIAMSHVSLMAASMDFRPDVVTAGIDEPGICGLAALPSGMRVAGIVGLS